MGIPSCRFTDRNHEQFTCTVCLDVAEDPIVVTDCEHIFCRKCVDIEGLIKCPSCQELFKEQRWTSLKGGFRRLYLDLKVKCLNTSCEHDMDISNFKEHDLVCPITFEFCKECGLKSRRGAENEHSCIQVIKDHYKGKLEQLEQKMDQKVEETMVKVELKEKEMEQKFTEMKKQLEQKLGEKMAKMKKEQLEGTEEKLKKERQRYESFIALAVTARNGFSDWEISDMNSGDFHCFRDPNDGSYTSNHIRDIKAILDKM